MSEDEVIVIAPFLMLLFSSVLVPYTATSATAFSISSGGNPIFTGWANVSSIEPQADTISILEYSYRGINT